MGIHSTAVVDPAAEIDPSASIGPYCVVGPRVKIGPDTKLLAHVVVENDTTIGARNVFHPFASVGGIPQDLKYRGEPSRLIIGDDNVIREGATLNIGTQGGGMETRVGNGCLLMAYSHVAHDCMLGDRVILANSVGLAGHITVDEQAILGGLVGVHQFCRIGRNAFIAGGSVVTQNVPPFCIAQGNRAKLVGINVVGLQRAGWSREKIQVVRKAFRKLFLSNSTLLGALENTEGDLALKHAEVAEMCRFIRTSERSVCSARMTPSSFDNHED